MEQPFLFCYNFLNHFSPPGDSSWENQCNRILNSLYGNALSEHFLLIYCSNPCLMNCNYLLSPLRENGLLDRSIDEEIKSISPLFLATKIIHTRTQAYTHLLDAFRNVTDLLLNFETRIRLHTYKYTRRIHGNTFLEWF